MGEVRAFSKRQFWTVSEVNLLREKYAKTKWPELLKLFPDRTRQQIHCKAQGLGLARPLPPPRTYEQVLEAKRNDMNRRRQRDPDAFRAKGRAHYADNRDAIRAKVRDYHQQRFFWSRAGKLKGKRKANYIELARLWKSQRGRCGLTGRRLDRSAQLDHILPRAKGGTDEISNLRWVCTEANLAKRDLTDAEFFALCGEVQRWIGERIIMARAA